MEMVGRDLMYKGAGCKKTVKVSGVASPSVVKLCLLVLLISVLLPSLALADLTIPTEFFNGGDPTGWSTNWTTNNANATPANGDLQTAASTGSSGTGPQSPYDGSFLFYEASSGAGADRFLTYASTLDLAAESVTVAFQANMYSTDTNMGTLEVQIDTASNFSNPTTVWTRSGDQGTAWFPGSVDLSTYSGTYYLRFRFIYGGGYRSDIAIDNVAISGVSKCSAVAPDTISAPSVVYNQVDLAWAYDGTNNDLGYEVWRDGTKISGAGYVTSGNYSDTTVGGGITYNYTVSGVASCGASGDSDPPLTVDVPAYTIDTTTGPMSFSNVGPSGMTVTTAFSGDDDADGNMTLNYGTTDGGPYPFSAVVSRGTGVYTATISGLTKSTPYYFQATFNDPDGVLVSVPNPNPVLGSQSTTDILLMHNSANLGTTYWSATGWGVSGGQYGEFTCATCHETNPSNGNIKRVRANISAGAPISPNTTTINNRAVVYSDPTSHLGADNTTHPSSNKICEVCHTQPAVHKYNQGTAVNHYGNDCTTCHKHKTSFKPPTDCAMCHDKGTGLGGAPIIFDSAGGTVNGGSEAYGAHLKAYKTETLDGNTNWEIQCKKCHGLHSGTMTDDGTSGGAPMAIPNRASVGIDYQAHGGIWLGGSETTGYTEAEICWNCHDHTDNQVSEWGANTAQSGSPVAAQYDYGSVDTSDWTAATWSSAKTTAFAYKTGRIQSTHSASTSGTSAVSGNAYEKVETLDSVINIRCSHCHDVHNTAFEYSVTADVDDKPYLRGTWYSNPYEEDGAPQTGQSYANDTRYGAVPRGNGSKSTRLGGYWIDVNNVEPGTATTSSGGTAYANPTTGWTLADSAGLCTLCHGSTVDTMDQTAGENLWLAGNGHRNSVLGGSTGGGTNIFNLRGSSTGCSDQPEMFFDGCNVPGENSAGFRGTAGNANDYQPPINPTGESAEGTAATNYWGVTVDGTTVDDQYHKFSCSKCHNPHASRLPKLMITNCLDTKHNTWDDGYQTIPLTSNINQNRSLSNWSSAQNCHRLGGIIPHDQVIPNGTGSYVEQGDSSNNTYGNTTGTATEGATHGTNTNYSNRGWNIVTPW